MNNATRRIDDDSSPRGVESQPATSTSAGRRAAAAAVLAGAIAAIAATFLPVLRIAVDRELQPALDRSGWDLHGPAPAGLALLGVILLPAAVRGSAVAAAAIAVTGLAILGIVVIADLPDVGDTGLVGAELAQGTARAGAGAYAEVLAGVLLVLGGGVLALLRSG